MTIPEYGTILIVEDDEGVALLQRRALERRGFQATCVTNIHDAISAAQSGEYVIVVSDYRLENATGLDLLARLHSLGLDLPVILVTGFSDESTAIEAIRLGARDFVPKTTEYLQYLPDAVERVLKAVRTEQDLAASEARFQLFMDNSPAAALIKDDEGRILYANRIYQQSLGTTDWKGKTDFELWPINTAEQLWEHDLIVLNSNKVSQVYESLPASDGEIRHFLSYKFPMRDARGSRFVGSMAVDITQQRNTEEALRQRDEQLRQSHKLEAIGTLAGGVAHEFNNLLQVVLGYTRFAISSIDETHSSQADLQVVVASAERAALLTQQLLSFSRRESAELMPFDMNFAIHELTLMLRPLIGKNIEIELALDDEIGTFLADCVQIQQLLMNLCINARDAMSQGGKITISTQAMRIDVENVTHVVTRSGDYIVLSVSDTGCGMDATVKQKIFEPFYTTKAVGQGTGLGLAMVYGIVQDHGGYLEVDSEPGVGTRFRIYLPRAESNSGTVEAPHPETAMRGSETILLADDEPLVLELAKRMLENAGYRVLTATDGREAIHLFKQHLHEVDLLIFDAVMPRLGGLEAICEIRNLHPSVPAIIASGYEGHTTPALPVEDFPRFIKKPYTLDALLETIHAVLEEDCQCPQQ